MPQLHPMLFQNPGLRNGDTVLHQHVSQFESMANLNQLIAELGEDVAAFMATVTNDCGLLPIDIMQDSVSICHEEYDVLYDKLLELMTPKHYLTLQTVLEQCPPEPVEESPTIRRLNHNSKMAIDVTNYLRSKISKSYTHPETNTFDFETHKKIESDIRNMRDVIDYSLGGRTAWNTCHHTMNASIGNCDEFAKSAYHLLTKNNPRLKAEVLELANGDHAILVIDRLPHSNLQSPETWGPTAVVCDAWIGEVYPASQIPNRLKNFSRYSRNGDHRMINTLLTYNPRYHLFNVIEQQGMKIKKHKVAVRKFGLFADDDKKRTADQVATVHRSKRQRRRRK